MARRNRAKIRKVLPDAKYGNVLVTRFINYIMLDGKKSAVEKAVYEAFELLQKNRQLCPEGDPVKAFEQAVENVRPKVEVRSRRIGGATYQIPCEVKDRRSFALALKWLTTAVRANRGNTLGEKTHRALMDALNNTGWAFKKKEDVFKMAESNKAFSHYN